MPMTAGQRRQYKTHLKVRREYLANGEFPPYKHYVSLLDRATKALKALRKRYEPVKKKWLKKKHPHQEN